MARSVLRFEEFVQEHLRSLLRTAYLISWDETEAEDLVQEALFRVARNWRRVAVMEHQFAYARRILVRLAVADAPKRRRRHAELSTDGGFVEAASGISGEASRPTALELRAELVDALGRLNPRQRAVIVLRYFFDLSESEAADAMGCSLGTVKSSSSRGLEQLRRLLPAEIHGSTSGMLPSNPRGAEL